MVECHPVTQAEIYGCQIDLEKQARAQVEQQGAADDSCVQVEAGVVVEGAPVEESIALLSCETLLSKLSSNENSGIFLGYTVIRDAMSGCWLGLPWSSVETDLLSDQLICSDLAVRSHDIDWWFVFSKLKSQFCTTMKHDVWVAFQSI